MATQTYEQLIAGANKIKENELPESNTNTLVGDQLLQMVGKQQEERSERTKGTTEYNVSVQFPTGGVDGTNKYTLESAIAKVPAELRSIGLKCSFLNDGGKLETWEYRGGAFTNISRWMQGWEHLSFNPVSGMVNLLSLSSESAYIDAESLSLVIVPDYSLVRPIPVQRNSCYILNTFSSNNQSIVGVVCACDKDGNLLYVIKKGIHSIPPAPYTLPFIADCDYIAISFYNNTKNNVYLKIDFENFSVNTGKIIKGDLLDKDYSCNYEIGKWKPFNKAILSFSETQKAVIITHNGGNYTGMVGDKEAFVPGINRIVKFEIKGISGNYSQISANRADAPGTNIIIPVTDEWSTVLIPLPKTGNPGMYILSYMSELYSIAIRNFYYADEGTSEFFRFKSELENKNTISDELAKRAKFDNTNASIHAQFIENKIADTGIPSWIGKIEFKTTDLMPSINNSGQAYLKMNDDNVELRIVKDATSIVGCTLIEKKRNVVSPKSFSMCHFGDSITYGVGADPNYITRLKSLLEIDGHTITKQTNLGISGTTAEGLYNSYKNTTPVSHDIATLMIGINDIVIWLSKYNANYESIGLKPEKFREWYRNNVDLLIEVIKNYALCTKLFLIVPTPCVTSYDGTVYKPSKDRYFCNSLMDVVKQELIHIAENDNMIHLCRGDYYVDSTLNNIPDGIHPGNLGAQLLAKGLRDEITFRV